MYKKTKTIKFILLAIATFLLDINPSKNKLSHSSLLSENMTHGTPVRPMKARNEYHSVVSPRNTILVICDEHEAYCDYVYGSIKQVNALHKNIMLTFYDQKIDSKFGTVVKLSFGDTSHTKVWPLSNYQPNSDLLYLSNYFSPSKLYYTYMPRDCLNYSYTIHLQLCAKQDIQKFCILLKTLVRLDAYDNGSYLYVPFTNSNIEFMQIFPFCILVFFCMFIDWMSYNTACLFVIISNLALYTVFSCTFLICVLFRKERCFLSLFYLLINMRAGFILFVISYVEQIVKTCGLYRWYGTHKQIRMSYGQNNICVKDRFINNKLLQ